MPTRDDKSPDQTTTTFILQCRDTPEVLERITGLLRRRGLRVRSLIAGLDETCMVRVTLQVDCDESRVAHVKANLSKLPNVLRVQNATDSHCLFRELAIIKVAAVAEERAEVMQIARAFRSRVIDVSRGSMAIEVTGSESKICALIELLGIYGIVEVARTGSLVVTRGPKPFSDRSPAVEPRESSMECVAFEN